jgi:hypothetical protein
MIPRPFFRHLKKKKNRAIFPVKTAIFPLLKHDFEVKLIVHKMPVGLYKIPPLYNPFFSKIK